MVQKITIVKRFFHRKYVQGLRRILGVLGIYDVLPLGQMDNHTLKELEE